MSPLDLSLRVALTEARAERATLQQAREALGVREAELTEAIRAIEDYLKLRDGGVGDRQAPELVVKDTPVTVPPGRALSKEARPERSQRRQDSGAHPARRPWDVSATAVLRLLVERGPLRTGAIAYEFGTSQEPIRPVCRELVSCGWAVVTGKTNGRKWSATNAGRELIAYGATVQPRVLEGEEEPPRGGTGFNRPEGQSGTAAGSTVPQDTPVSHRTDTSPAAGPSGSTPVTVPPGRGKKLGGARELDASQAALKGAKPVAMTRAAADGDVWMPPVEPAAPLGWTKAQDRAPCLGPGLDPARDPCPHDARVDGVHTNRCAACIREYRRRTQARPRFDTLADDPSFTHSSLHHAVKGGRTE